MGSSSTPPDTPYYSSGNRYLQGGLTPKFESPQCAPGRRCAAHMPVVYAQLTRSCRLSPFVACTVASWPQQALKASESSSEQSAVLVETNW